jgi:MFS family permease
LHIGTLYALREIAVNVMEIPTGIIADAIGRRRAMIISFVGYILSFVLFYVSNTYVSLVLAMLFFAVGDAFRTGTHKAMILSYLEYYGLKEHKVKYYGNTRSWSQLGSALVAIPAAMVVFFSGDFQIVFLIAVIPYVLNLLLMLSYPTSTEGSVKKGKDKSIKHRFGEILREILISYKTPKVRKLTLNLGLYFGFFKAVKDYLQPIILLLAIGLPVFAQYNQVQRSSLLIGALYFLIYLLGSFTSRHSNKISFRLGGLGPGINKTLILSAMLAIGVGAALKFEINSMAIVGFAGFFVLQNIRKPLGTAYWAELVEEKVLATSLSVQSQADTLFSALFALLMGFVADKAGIEYTLLITGCILAIGAWLWKVR